MKQHSEKQDEKIGNKPGQHGQQARKDYERNQQDKGGAQNQGKSREGEAKGGHRSTSGNH